MHWTRTLQANASADEMGSPLLAGMGRTKSCCGRLSIYDRGVPQPQRFFALLTRGTFRVIASLIAEELMNTTSHVHARNTTSILVTQWRAPNGNGNIQL